MQNSLLLIACAFLFSCNQKVEVELPASEPAYDSTAVSLYRLNGDIIDLERLEKVSVWSDARDFRQQQPDSRLKTILYSRWCADGYCYEIDNNTGTVDVFPAGNALDVKPVSFGPAFLIPTSQGVLSFFSKADEHLFNVQHINAQGPVLWTSIYEHRSGTEEDTSFSATSLMGYNEQVVIFRSTGPGWRRSGLIQIADGRKRMEDAQWEAVLLDDDGKTVLGFVVRNPAGEKVLQLGGSEYLLPASAQGYGQISIKNAGDYIAIACYEEGAADARIFLYAYGGGRLIWDYIIMGGLSVSGMTFGMYGPDRLLVEVFAAQKQALYVLNMKDGGLLARF